MFNQFMSVLQLAGVFATFFGAYILLIEYLMPSGESRFQAFIDK